MSKLLLVTWLAVLLCASPGDGFPRSWSADDKLMEEMPRREVGEWEQAEAGSPRREVLHSMFRFFDVFSQSVRQQLQFQVDREKRRAMLDDIVEFFERVHKVKARFEVWRRYIKNVATAQRLTQFLSIAQQFGLLSANMSTEENKEKAEEEARKKLEASAVGKTWGEFVQNFQTQTPPPEDQPEQQQGVTGSPQNEAQSLTWQQLVKLALAGNSGEEEEKKTSEAKPTMEQLIQLFLEQEQKQQLPTAMTWEQLIQMFMEQAQKEQLPTFWLSSLVHRHTPACWHGAAEAVSGVHNRRVQAWWTENQAKWLW